MFCVPDIDIGHAHAVPVPTTTNESATRLPRCVAVRLPVGPAGSLLQRLMAALPGSRTVPVLPLPDEENPMIELTTERPADAAAIETLLDQAFGADRHAKSSYSYRKRVGRIWPLCLVAREAGAIVGTIRYWPIAVGPTAAPALLLGPVAVRTDHRASGVGGMLMRTSLARAAAAGHHLVILVGDEPYYGRFGFRPAAEWGISMRHENPARVLAMPLGPAMLEGAAIPPVPSGTVARRRLVRGVSARVLAA